MMAACLAATFAVSLTAATGRQAAAQHYQRAQELLEDLRAVPRLELGKKQYGLVIEAFRGVQRSSPASGYCDDALLSIADLYAEMNDRFGDDGYRDKAIDGYRFLIREYPHSKLLDEAKKALARLESGQKQTLSQVKRPKAEDDEPPTVSRAEPAPAPAEPVQRAAKESKPAPAREEPAKAAPAKEAAAPQVVAVSTSSVNPLENRAAETPARLHKGLADIRGLRYWSTPEYTRIALELDDYAPYKFEFLARPRRVYFDLFSAQLSGDLIRGANHEIGDRAVERLRIAMNRSNKARLVMDLNDEVSYDISWLTNPPRLMIELRAKTALRQTLARQEEPEPAPVDVEEPAAAEVVAVAEEPEPAEESEEAEEAELAAVLEQPAPEVMGRVEPEPEPMTFAEAFRALSGDGPRRRTTRNAAPEPRHKPEPQRQPEPEPVKPPPPAPQPKAEAAKAPEPAPAVSEQVAEEVPAKAAEKAPEPAPEPEPEPVVLAKLEKPAPAPATLKMAPPKPAETPAKGSPTLIRALGLKVGKVVIDAGHGGHDTGTIGPSGLREKDVVLDIAQRLGAMIEKRLGSEVLYTRDGDKFLDLRKRTTVANQAQADLFVSIHANASSTRSVRGVETYYLNFTTDPWALKVASRENAASDNSVHELQDLLSKIALKEKIDESREFATRMQGSLYDGLAGTTKGLRNRGVRQAPFTVLIGAKMPAILAEIGFLSNPTDEKLMQGSKYRQQVAEFLFEGIESYVGSLSSHHLTMTDQERASASLD